MYSCHYALQWIDEERAIKLASRTAHKREDSVADTQTLTASAALPWT